MWRYATVGAFDLKQRCAEWSPYDIKYSESDKRADGSYAFEWLSRYFDVIHGPFCGAPLKVERAYRLQAVILTSLRGWNTDWAITWDRIRIVKLYFLLTYLRMFSHVYFVLKLVLMWRRWSVHVRLGEGYNCSLEISKWGRQLQNRVGAPK